MKATWHPFSSTWCRERQIMTFPHHKAWTASRNASSPMMDTPTWVWHMRTGMIHIHHMWDRSTQRLGGRNSNVKLKMQLPLWPRTQVCTKHHKVVLWEDSREEDQTLIWSQSSKCEILSPCCDLHYVMRKPLNCKQYNHGWVTSHTAPCHRKQM